MKPRAVRLLAIGALAVVPLVVASLIWRSDKKSPAEAAAIVQATEVGAAQDRQSQPPGPSSLKPSSRAADRPSVNMAEAMRSSTNLRAFIEYAKQHPERGGYYYAMKALRFCGVFGKTPERLVDADSMKKDDHATAQRRQRLIQDQLRACDGVLPSEIGEAYSTAMALRALALEDPLFAASHALNAARDSGSAREEDIKVAIGQVLRLRDPMLLHDVGMSLSEFRSQDNSYYFDGHWYSGSERLVLEGAWLLVPCSFGLPCGESDLDVRVACAVQGICASDRRSLVQAVIFQGDAALLRRAEALSTHLSSAVLAERIGAFRSK